MQEAFYKQIPLYSFAYHKHPDWLDQLSLIAKPEPWGHRKKILELYLRANFEIAKGQNKVYEDADNGIAFWRAGWLSNVTADPIWMVYDKNHHDSPKWYFRKAITGSPPVSINSSAYNIGYNPPDFEPDWKMNFHQSSIGHILTESRNVERLQTVFSTVLGDKYNEHLIFSVIYGQIELNRKNSNVIPQWYKGDYQFLMPLCLTSPEKVELCAALQPDENLRRYNVRTLLLPHYGYAYARALVRNKAQFADWMALSEDQINQELDEDPQQ
jgi:hypothetical protein